MADIEVKSPGFYTTIQDLGRTRTAQYGVPQSGAMDSHSARKANLLLNNYPNDALLEITFSGPILQFNKTTMACFTGAIFQVKHNETIIEQDKIFQLNPGDRLSFGKLQEGFRAYLAVSGGLDSEVILGSKSQYESLTEAFRLAKGDVLKIGDSTLDRTISLARVQFRDSIIFNHKIEVLPGPEYDLLTNVQKKIIEETGFSITSNSNRMAIQLKEKLENDLQGITTAPTRPGTVQLTPSGQLMVLMRDCQTTGGYPRILQLSEMGINSMAQQAPGKSITFQMLVK